MANPLTKQKLQREIQVPNEQQDTGPIARKDACMYIQGLRHTVS